MADKAPLLHKNSADETPARVKKEIKREHCLKTYHEKSKTETSQLRDSQLSVMDRTHLHLLVDIGSVLEKGLDALFVAYCAACGKSCQRKQAALQVMQVISVSTYLQVACFASMKSVCTVSH